MVLLLLLLRELKEGLQTDISPGLLTELPLIPVPTCLILHLSMVFICFSICAHADSTRILRKVGGWGGGCPVLFISGIE